MAWKNQLTIALTVSAATTATKLKKDISIVTACPQGGSVELPAGYLGRICAVLNTTNTACLLYTSSRDYIEGENIGDPGPTIPAGGMVRFKCLKDTNRLFFWRAL